MIWYTYMLGNDYDNKVSWHLHLGFPGGIVIKDPLPMQELQETWVLFLAWEEPLESGHGNSLQYSCLKNSMDRGTWQATAEGVTKESDTTEHTRKAHNTSITPHNSLSFFFWGCDNM